MANGQKELSSQATGAVTKDYGPNTSGRGEEFGTSLVNMTLSDLTGAAESQSRFDPLRHKILGTDDTVASLRSQVEQSQIPTPTFRRGDKVYHKERKLEGTISSVISDSRVEIKTSKGKIVVSASKLVKL